MKNTLLLLVAIAASLFSFAQDNISKNDLIGTWQPVHLSMNKGAMTYDYATHKLSVADSVRKTWQSAEDSAQMVEFLNMMFEEMGKMTMGFKSGDVYVETSPSGKEKSGTYSLKGNGLVVTTSNGVKQTFSVKKKETLLVLESDLDESRKLELLLQKK